MTLIVVGTADLHGHIEMLPYLGGYLANLRAARGADAVILLDGGDLFQGTLESNLDEGASVVEAYTHLGYTAAAIGNHEFDFGPAGQASVPEKPGDDPRGALKARAAASRFPFLAANLVESPAGGRVAWPNVVPSILIERAGIRVGIVGVTTESTPRTTASRNFAGLAVTPLAPAIAAEAAELRRRGARIVLVAAHAGGKCRELDDPTEVHSCALDEEIFQVARALPPGAVDVIVAGHTHSGVAHEVAGTAVIESFANGVAFGRVDLVVDPGRGLVSRRIHRPRFVCGRRGRDDGDGGSASCSPGSYEGRPVVPDRDLAALVARRMAAARELRESPLGVVVDSPVRRAHGEESALGNLFADLMREARPDADVAITNGGGLRADLPAGRLTYGTLYEAIPFDNRFARVQLSGAELAHVIAANLERRSGILSLSGLRVTARCRGGALEVSLRRERDGTRVGARDRLVMVTNDFLASGGDDMLAGLDLPSDAIRFEDGATIRDAIAGVLRARGGHLRGDDLRDPRAPRIALPGPRPVRCQ